MMVVISMKIMDTIGCVENVDKEVGEAMEAELARQRRNLELIASENIVSPAVMAAMGSVLTNKYAEGYSGKPIDDHDKEIVKSLLAAYFAGRDK